MKLFIKEHKVEGEGYPTDVLLAIGNKRNGWYAKIELPFTLTRKYVDHSSFEWKTGKCRPILMWSYFSNYKKVMFHSVWRPV